VHLIGIAFSIIGMSLSGPFLWIGYSKWVLLQKTAENYEKTEE
jgi:hypothetical protein